MSRRSTRSQSRTRVAWGGAAPVRNVVLENAAIDLAAEATEPGGDPCYSDRQSCRRAGRGHRIAKNVALEINRDEDLPEQAVRERRYLDRELLTLARATDRFETLTLVAGVLRLAIW